MNINLIFKESLAYGDKHPHSFTGYVLFLSRFKAIYPRFSSRKLENDPKRSAICSFRQELGPDHAKYVARSSKSAASLVFESNCTFAQQNRFTRHSFPPLHRTKCKFATLGGERERLLLANLSSETPYLGRAIDGARWVRRLASKTFPALNRSNLASEREKASRFWRERYQPAAGSWRSGLIGRQQRDDFAEFGADLPNGRNHSLGRLHRICRLLALVLCPRWGGLRSRPPMRPIQRLPRPGNRVALSVNQPLDLKGQFHLAAPVKPLTRAALVGLQLRKLRLPETEDVWFYTTDARYIADLEVKAIGDDRRVDNALSGKV